MNPPNQVYCGRLNLLDRDYWNASLEQRSFLLQRPIVHNLNYPQSTSWCNFKTRVPSIITDSRQHSQAENYYRQWLIGDKNTGLPVTSKYFNPARPVQTNYKPTHRHVSEFGANHPVVFERQAQRNFYDKSIAQQKYRPAVTGVNFNIDVQSKLLNLDHYCPKDTLDTRLDYVETHRLPPTQALIKTNTPHIWRNTTKLLNRCTSVDVPASKVKFGC